jgi:hypothetical protein
VLLPFIQKKHLARILEMRANQMSAELYKLALFKIYELALVSIEILGRNGPMKLIAPLP